MSFSFAYTITHKLSWLSRWPSGTSSSTMWMLYSLFICAGPSLMPKSALIEPSRTLFTSETHSSYHLFLGLSQNHSWVCYKTISNIIYRNKDSLVLLNPFYFLKSNTRVSISVMNCVLSTCSLLVIVACFSPSNRKLLEGDDFVVSVSVSMSMISQDVWQVANNSIKVIHETEI